MRGQGTDRAKERLGVQQTIPLLGRGAALVYFTLVLFLVVFVSSWVSFAMKPERAVPNVFLLLAAVSMAALAGGAAISLCRSPLRGFLERENVFGAAVVLGGLLLFALQIAICYGGWFVTGWDLLAVAPSVEEIARGLPVSDVGYYEMYPNNLFLTGLQGFLARWAALVGITGKTYLLTVLGSCMCVTLSVCLGAAAAKRLARSVWAGYASLLLGGVFAGLSPWVLVPYSDTYGMLCPALALYLYTRMKDWPAKWFLVTGVCLVGTWIKPTAVLLLAAITLVHGVPYFSGKRPFGLHWKPLARRAGAAALAGVLALGIKSGVCAATGLQPDPEKALRMAHYAMVGMNPHSEGIWNEEDVVFSTGISGAQERSRANWAAAVARVQGMGPLGLGGLAVRKTLNNYADGTFSWAREGLFFQTVHGKLPGMQAFYGIGQEEASPAFFAIWQVLWLLILAGLVLGWLGRRPDLGECVLYVTLLGLSLFLTIFECRGRYLLLYAPYYVIGGVLGWRSLYQRLRKGKT